jgi:type IV pilus assembly protein PilV
MDMYIHPKRVNNQSGIILLEGLIAILIFSLGIIALVGMQATAVRQVSDAKYRSDASLLANQLLGVMWVSDRTPATLKANFDTSVAAAGAGATGALYTWMQTVQNTLPGITPTSNQPTVDVTSLGAANDGTVTITITWAVPGDVSGSHQYVTIAQVR